MCRIPSWCQNLVLKVSVDLKIIWFQATKIYDVQLQQYEFFFFVIGQLTKLAGSLESWAQERLGIRAPLAFQATGILYHPVRGPVRGNML